MTESRSERPSAVRREELEQLFNDAILPHRRHLRQYRDHTWQSAHVDSDGTLAELIAAITTNTLGSATKGKTGDRADLEDGTEVKCAYRVDPNIDFIIRGTVVELDGQRALRLRDIPAEWRLHDVQKQINANASSIQLVNGAKVVPGTPDLVRTASKNSLVLRGDDYFLRLSRQSKAQFRSGMDVQVCVRQERGHINFGDRTREQLHRMFSRKPPVLVFYSHDRMGRSQLVVIRVGLRSEDLDHYLDRIFTGSRRKCQVQPYLYPDNVRDRFYDSEVHSVVAGLNGELLAFGVETHKGFKLLHFEPDRPPHVRECLDLLTSVADPEDCPAFWHSKIDVDLESESGRRLATGKFYESTVLPWYESIGPYCDRWNVTRNVGLGNLSQHLISLRTRVRGTRSGARGSDLVEEDGGVSEVKLASGEPIASNPMKNTDVPRLNLGSNTKKLLSWERLFPVRICDAGDGLQILLHAPTKQTMREFRQQVEAYFRVHSSSANLQYHALGQFPNDLYGVQGRTLSFERVAWLMPDGAHRFQSIP